MRAAFPDVGLDSRGLALYSLTSDALVLNTSGQGTRRAAWRPNNSWCELMVIMKQLMGGRDAER